MRGEVVDVRYGMAAVAFSYVARPRRLDRCGGFHIAGVHAGRRADMGSPSPSQVG